MKECSLYLEIRAKSKRNVLKHGMELFSRNVLLNKVPSPRIRVVVNFVRESIE